MDKGDYIYLWELHAHQRGKLGGGKFSKSELYAHYATRPEQWLGSAGAQDTGNTGPQKGVDSYWGKIMGDAANAVNSYNPVPEANIPTGAELDNAQILMKRISHASTPLDATAQVIEASGNWLIEGAKYWGNEAVSSVTGHDAGWYESTGAPSGGIVKKLGPKIGNQIFTNDIYVYDTDVTLKSVSSDIIESVDNTLPILVSPDPSTFVTTGNSSLTTIRKSPNISFTNPVTETDTDAVKYDIAQSNIVYTQDNDIQNCLMEHIYAHSTADATLANELKTVNSTLGHLQESRIQKYVPAPLNIWPEDIAFQPHPHIDIPIKIQLPLAFSKNSEGSAKTRMRRALFIGFTRYPLGKDTDILNAYNATMRKQSYGLVIYRSGVYNNDDYLTVTSWDNLNLTNANDPYFNDDGESGHGSGSPIYGYLARNEVEEEYILLRLSMTYDGIKASFLKPNPEGGVMTSILYGDKYTYDTSTTDNQGIPDNTRVGIPYIDVTGNHYITDATGGSTSLQAQREYSQARRYHIKSGLAGTRGSTTSQYNAWKKGMSPGGAWDETLSGIEGGTDTQKSASLPYMWCPYLTIATTNTRYNADTTNWPDGASSAEGNQARFTNKDSISRVYIDSIQAHRFNYEHANASVNSGNSARSAIVIPRKSPYTYTKVSPTQNPYSSTNTGINEDDNTAGVHTATGPVSYTYISLGFKSKSDIEGAQKYLLFNGFYQDLSPSETPIDNYDAMMYSCESEPMGEFHWRSYYTGAVETQMAYKNTNIRVGAGPSDQSTNQGQPILKYSFFGTTNTGPDIAVNIETIDRDTGLTSGSSTSYFPNNSGLQRVDGATVGGWDSLGVNKIEKFNNKGILSINFTDHDTNGPTEAELGATVYAHPSHPTGVAGTADNNINGSTNYDTYKFDIGYNASNTYATNTWHTSWGLYEKTKQSVSTVMPDYCLPNLNWMIKWSGGTNDGKIGIITGLDADGVAYMGKESVTSYPANDNYGYLFPGFFVKRENPFVQARVLETKRKTAGDGGLMGNTLEDPEIWEIEVDSPPVLSNADDEIYIIYRASSEWIPSIENQHPTTGGYDHRGESTSIKRQNNNTAVLCKIKSNLGSGKFTIVGCNAAGVEGATDGTSNSMDVFEGISTIYGGSLKSLIFDSSVDRSSGALMGYDTKATPDDVPRGRFLNSNLCISPYRYWLYIRVPQQDVEKSYNAICEITSSTDVDFSQEAEQADCVFQSTYNENQYTDSSDYSNKWGWDPKSLESHLDIGTDYGFGAYDGQKDKGGYCGIGNVHQGRYNRYAIDGVVRAGADSSQSITIVGLPNEHEDIMYKFDSAEGSNPPYLMTVFSDALPVVPTDFKVKPDEESAFYPKFTWATADDDLWYGFLIIDSKPIKNQYHGCVLHVPLNESEPSSTVTKYYRPDQNVLYKNRDAAGAETQSGYMTVSGSAVHTKEGLAGNTIVFDGTDDSVSLSGVQYTAPTTEMTISLHIRPDSLPTNTQTLLEKLYEYSIQLDTNGQIVAKVWPDTGVTGIASDIPLELKSISAIPCDTDTPSNIMLVVDTGLKYGNVKLFVDGKLEDQTGLKKAESSANNWPLGKNIGYRGTAQLYIGQSTFSEPSAFYKGKMEELTIYNTTLLPVTPSDGELLFTKPVSELSTATEAVSKSYGAKLFIKDYHNIRGVSNTEVCSTAQISFRKAAFRLNTT